MSCPHVTGIATYVKAFHLGWSPAATKYAIMTSANPMNGSQDDIGEYACGFGHVKLVQAIDPGLVYDISLEDYLQIFCNLGYDSKKIKQISGQDNPCSQTPHRSLVSSLNYLHLLFISALWHLSESSLRELSQMLESKFKLQGNNFTKSKYQLYGGIQDFIHQIIR